MKKQLLGKLSRFGVLPRSDVRNDLAALRGLMRQKLVRKVCQKGRVFYEVTENALPLLECYRKLLFHKAELLKQMTPNAKFYRALLENLRFLDERHPLAAAFQFLGDWELKRPVVPGQLKLSQNRFYHERR